MNFATYSFFFFLALGMAPDLKAEVIDSGKDGFLIKHAIIIPASPKDVYERFIQPSLWWDSKHTWSGQAKNLTMIPKAGGCFCEIMENDGSVMHMTIVYVDPAKAMRLHGALGPLQMDGVSGSMIVEFQDDEAISNQTILKLSYSVGGYRSEGFNSLAPLVDGVLGVQINRLKDGF